LTVVAACAQGTDEAARISAMLTMPAFKGCAP
jgi:hypothetical protein